MRREKNCVKCGKPFLPTNAQHSWCHSPCRPKSHRIKYKNSCENCGRRLRTLILPDSPEKVLCSFCEERIRAEKRQQRYEETKRTLGKCKNCGVSGYLYRGSRMCHTCFFKSKNPQILDVREVKSA